MPSFGGVNLLGFGNTSSNNVSYRVLIQKLPVSRKDEILLKQVELGFLNPYTLEPTSFDSHSLGKHGNNIYLSNFFL